jgi:hypothetical protein
VKVDYADRELAPNGGFMPEDFAAYMESICKLREAEGYFLVSVLPGPVTDGEVRGAWLFFSDQPFTTNQTPAFDVGAAVEMPEGRRPFE